MNLQNSHLQHLYTGFLNTPSLWNSNAVLGLNQLQMSSENNTLFKRNIKRLLRLGQLAEQFAFNQLEELKTCKILAENIQIQKNKQTLGELDALLELDSERIHLEIIYKFYLFDETLGNSEIEQWIGPNRNDSLVEKLMKLKNKQLPLLYSSECQLELEELRLSEKSFQQRVLFKAQLFVPYQKLVNCNQLNESCICGFYINKEQLNDFADSKFYIPPKLDWFIMPNHSVDWLGFETFTTEVNLFLNQHKSPLIWIKKPDQTLLKCFLVWW